MIAIRYAFRSLKRSPLFVVVAVLSLGIGLGLTTTMFAVVDAVLNPPVAYAQPERLYTVMWHVDTKHLPVTTRDAFEFIRDRANSFDAVIPLSWSHQPLEAAGQARDVFVGRVPPSFFRTLGARPMLGRFPGAGDDPDAGIVVSRGMWKGLYGSRRSLEGATATIGGRTYPIVAVSPRGMELFWGDVLMLNPDTSGTGLWRPLVRLREDVTIEQATAEMTSLARQMTDQYNARLIGPFDFGMQKLAEGRGYVGAVPRAMLGAAVAVLLIACANLANLMLARGLAKRREVALRLAMGATRATVVRQMFVECAIIAVLGGALGVLMSIWGGSLLISSIPRELQWIGIVEPALSWRVFAMALLAVASAAIAFGLIPTIRVVSQVSLDEPLKDGGTSSARVRQRYSGLVVAEIALALVLVMAGGLLTKSVLHIRAITDNFDARRLMQAFGRLGGEARPSAEEMEEVRRGVISQLRGVPGVVDAALQWGTRPPGGAITAELTDSTRAIPMITYPVVTSSFITTMGLQVAEGRAFTQGDVAHGGAILSVGAAQALYPHGSAVGRMVKLGGPAADAPWVPVVGVVRAAVLGRTGLRMHVLGGSAIYVAKSLGTERGFGVLVRLEREDPRAAAGIMRAIKSVDPRMVGGGALPYLYYMEQGLASQRFLSRVFVTIACFALALAAVGLYGVLAYAVAQRYRELAIRVAVGARGRDLLRVVAHDTTVMVLAGTAIGAFVALFATPILGDVLGDVHPADAWTLVITELVIMLTAALAAFVPARRAMKADPMAILRAI